MLLLLALALGLVIGLATGGRLGNLAHLRFRWPYLVLAALLVKEVGLLTPLNRIEGIQYLYVLSLAGIVVWTLWHAYRLPGVWLVTIGSALNMLVVIANGGRMPVARELAARGSHILVDRGVVGQYVLMGPNTRLGWLADWLSLPGPLGNLQEAYSPGDLVVALGIGLVAFLATRRRVEGYDPGETSGRILIDPP